jgi:hypothetical protein
MADTTQNENTLADPNTEKEPKPIAEFAARDDYPHCALGECVDIGGVTGVVFEIAGNSLKMRTAEGRPRSFNYHTLKKLYGPRHIDFDPSPQKIEEAPAETAPVSQEIPDPDFHQEQITISQFISEPDFPVCTLGRMVEINGYVGVVVELTGLSMKVRSPNGTSRKYNADVLRKLHGKPSA